MVGLAWRVVLFEGGRVLVEVETIVLGVIVVVMCDVAAAAHGIIWR